MDTRLKKGDLVVPSNKNLDEFYGEFACYRTFPVLASKDTRWGQEVLVEDDAGEQGWYSADGFDLAQAKRDEHAPTTDVAQQHHYKRFEIEPLVFIAANKLPFWAGNVVKYVCRHDAKDGLKDLKKARDYLDKEIRRLEGEENWCR